MVKSRWDGENSVKEGERDDDDDVGGGVDGESTN